MRPWFQVLAAIFTAAPLLAPPQMALAQSAAAPTKVVFSLDFIPLGRHAPWYAALAEGYYKDEGLDVSIIPAQGTAQVIQAVESGTANIGFVDVPSVVIARGNGSKLKMLAINYEKAPYAIFSLTTAPMSRSRSSSKGSISAAAPAASRRRSSPAS